MGQFHESLVPSCQFFLSLLLSFAGWSPGAQELAAFSFLPGLLRSTCERALGGAPSAIQAGACGLREQCKSLVWSYIGFLHKPRNICLFLSSIFLTATFFLYLSLNLSRQCCLPWGYPWILLGLDPSSQDCILSPCLFNFYAEYIMRNAGLKKHKLESRLLGEISITSGMQMTPPLWQKVKRN